MKQLPVFLVTLSLIYSTSLQSQIVINEIRATDGHVEIKNIGATSVDISGYQLCSSGMYNQLSSILVCPADLTIEAGTLVTVNFSFPLFANDGELGLYFNGLDFSSSANIRDYVEWGMHGHLRSMVAEAAGIWANNDFVPDWSACMSLEYDGSGDASSNWITQDMPTLPCLANTLNGCSPMPLELLSFQVQQIENGAGVEWKAVHDPTVSLIYLEHSIDEKSWDRMTEWQTKGPDFDLGEYHHNNVSSGTHYYRLMTDYLDGDKEISALRALRMCYDSDNVSVWPNPTSGMLEVFVQAMDPSPTLEFIIVDTHGKVCIRQLGLPHTQIDLSPLTPGVYFLHIPSVGIVHRIIKS